MLANSSGIHGNIQIQAAKTLEGKGNVDQVYGRANLMWAYNEDSTFSSLVHVRAYPAGFGYEPLIGGSFIEDKEKWNFKTPAITSQQPANDLPTWHVYQAWIKYRFPDFDIRLGRLLTDNSHSLFFGNYLDITPGGTFTLGRHGIHNAVEFSKGFGIFNTRAHLGVGDYVGNRGFLRLFEEITPTEKISLGLGYKINVFDLIHHDINEDESMLTNSLVANFKLKAHPLIFLFGEVGWSHLKGNDDGDPIPVMAGFDIITSPILKKLNLPDVLDFFRVEMEYLYDRKIHSGFYKGVDQDFQWCVSGDQTWLKRMHFQGSLFGAPTADKKGNMGIGLRFTSEIN